MSYLKSSSSNDYLKAIQKQIYQPPKSALCHQHSLPIEFICLSKKCERQGHLTCKACSPCYDRHPVINVKKIVPKLSQWIVNQWKHIENERNDIQSEWKICMVNVNYCIDILNQVKKQIEQRTSNIEIRSFNQILTEIHTMFMHKDNNGQSQILVKNFRKLNEKYNFFESDTDPVHCKASEFERNSKINQAKSASLKTKQFSQKALAFSQTLAQIIEQKIKYEKRLNKLKQLTTNRIFCLRDLLHEKEQNLQNINDLIIQVPKSKTDYQIQDLIQKCPNLKSLQINNKNGTIELAGWRKITSGMQYLKSLKELKLYIRAVDLPMLIELFKQKSNAVRLVDKLNLQITDQKELDCKLVAEFCNTMQLKSLNLTLTRDNLSKQKAIELIKGLRIHTSMSQLPMNQLHFNLNKNKIDSSQTHEIQQLFMSKCKTIKSKSIII